MKSVICRVLYIVSYNDSRPLTLLYMRVPVRWFIFSMLLKTCCISFSVIDLLGKYWGRGGFALSSNCVCMGKRAPDSMTVPN